jgi:DNA polymerase-3 subunit epsilon
MNFHKDLLLIDLETTGLDASRQEIIQLSAILLDKKTLKEKSFFNAYAKPVKWAQRNKESMRINGIKKEWLNAAPSLSSVLKEFNKKFNASEVILSYYGGPVDMDFLRAAYYKHKIKWQFDYHYFNLWAYFYAVLAGKNQLKNKKKFTGFSLEDLMKKFKIKSQSRHDGLEDCRIEAEVLRKLIK